MKKTILILLIALFIGCSSDDDNCDCVNSAELGIMIPQSWSQETIDNAIENMSQEQKTALNNECKKKCE